jgi:hypothetical protein
MANSCDAAARRKPDSSDEHDHEPGPARNP